MLLRNLAVSVREKITDKYDYFDASDAAGEPADLDKVFGTPEDVGCRWDSGRERKRARQRCWKSFYRRPSSAWCWAALCPDRHRPFDHLRPLAS